MGNFYAGPPRVCLGVYTDRDKAKAEKDKLTAEGRNAWLEVTRNAGLTLWALKRKETG